MSEPVAVHAEPSLDDPLLVVALDGWVDAGSAMTLAVAAITDQCEPVPVATFDPDTFLDYRARRPTLSLVDGVNTGLEWPFTEVVAGHDLDGRDLLVLRGAEPDAKWHLFLGVLRELVVGFGVTRSVTIGAYPAAVPHTRPIRLTVTATADALVDPLHAVPGRIELPAGMSAAVEQAMADAGIPAIGLWAQVPHYASTVPCPEAAVALLEALADRGSRRFSTDATSAMVDAAREQLDAIIERSEDGERLVAELERLHDQIGIDDTILPSGDEIAADLQRFLRGLDD